MPDRAPKAAAAVVAAGQAAPNAQPTLWLRLSGVPGLVFGGREQHPGTRKALALALMVALEPGLRRSRAADLLWPDADPAAARRNIRRDLFRLRQIGLTLVDGAGEALQLTRTEITWPTPGAAHPRWLDGLDEVAGAEFSHWVAEQRALLHKRWLLALEARARACEREGALDAALQAWRGLLADAAAGPGHAEARAALQRLQAEAGAAGETPAPRGSSSAAAPGPRVPFVGRVNELQAMRQALASGRALLVDGSPGIGKTRTALEALAEHGGVLLLRCRPEDQAVPYAGALRALSVLREAAPDVKLPAWVRRDLALLVPEWGPAPSTADPERLARAYRAALVVLAKGNFGAWLIDDWQWADAPSQLLWQPLPPPPLPLVLVHRSGELPPSSLELRRDWLDRGWAAAVRLAPLASADARALVALLQPDAAPSLQFEWLQRAAGNPFFLLEMQRHSRQRGDAPLPASLQAMVVARARALGPGVRRVLEAACLIDGELSSALLSRAIGLDELAVVQALEHAVTAELLMADARGRLRLAHDLVAQAIAESLSPLRRQALHAQLAGALEHSGAEPGRIARHLHLADRPVDAAPWQLRAARVAIERCAWAQARQACAAVLAVAQDAALRFDARLVDARALRRQSDAGASLAALQAALGDAAAVGPGQVVELELQICELLNSTDRADKALARLQRLEDDPALAPLQRQRVLTEQANALACLGRHAQSLPILERLLDELPASAWADRLRVGNLRARNLYWAGRLDDSWMATEALLVLARQLGNGLEEASHLYRLGVMAREQGRVEAACAWLQQAIGASRALGHIELLRSALTTLCTVRLDQLQLDEAEALLAECAQAAPYWDSPNLEDVYDERLYRLHQLRGEVDAAWAVTERSLARNRGGQNLHSHLGTLMQAVDLAVHTGDVARARRHLDEALDLHGQAGAESLHGRELESHVIEVLRAEGDAGAALRRADAWLAADAPRRVQEHARVLINGALAALRCGQPARAAAHLAALDGVPVLSMQQQAHRHRARLALARACHSGRNASAALALAVTEAEQWLTQPRLPAIETRLLREALLSADGKRPGA